VGLKPDSLAGQSTAGGADKKKAMAPLDTEKAITHTGTGVQNVAEEEKEKKKQSKNFSQLISALITGKKRTLVGGGGRK